MKTKSILPFVILVLTLFSCKNKTEDGASKVAAPVKENFIVELDVNTSKKDDFTVYYTEDKTNEFDGIKAVWKGVLGGGTDEKVIIELPVDVIPTNIRLDFGINPEREDVIVNKITLKYLDKVFDIRGADFLNYFIKNDVPTEVDTAKGTIKIIKTKEKVDGTYFYPRQELLDQIALMTK